ncbi:TIM barrel protein [Saxibacter everestensis]|uniref:TIM barrel protein n=1 Tax=Saxibacter everestensis TaxID=2909229 RepID=A0ABY8QTQ7_9MICO|nr:TIM barrel protein [Brevibacteriaceae bacterium ZFBP1038]
MTLSTAQIAGSNFAYQHLPLETFLDDMADLGREQLELWGIAPQLHIPELAADDLLHIRNLMADRGLHAYCVTPEQVAYPVNVASPVEWMRRSSIGMFLRAAEVCAELEAPYLFLTPGRGFENERTDAAWQRSVDALSEIASRAQELGVGCILEPLQRVESNLVNDSKTLRRMIADIGAPNVGGALDTVAMATAGETVADYHENLGSLIRHVHLIDGRPTGHLAWDEGQLPLREYLAGLETIGYDGYLTFELFGDGQYAFDPRRALDSCFAAVERELGALHAAG